MSIQETLHAQRKYFESGATLAVAERKKVLNALADAVKQRTEEIASALASDLGKSFAESYMTEIGMVLAELKVQISRLTKWSRPRRVRTPLAQFPSKSYVLPSPYGVTLVMSPWNYPFLLSFCPLIDAFAAGNTVIVKPSAYAPSTSAVIKSLCAECFDSRHVSVIEGGRTVNAELLDCRFDYIFFTGSVEVGREVMTKAAARLTPITLELGGKSPCIIDSSANLALAARRIAFGKFLNVGQTCVAPDYLLIEESIKDKFLPLLYGEIKKQYGNTPLANADYGKIVNNKHYLRLCGLIDPNQVLFGGRAESGRIEPTVVSATLNDAVMLEEIFGPILPVLTFKTREEARETILLHPTPLALYLFSTDKEAIRYFTRNISFGGGCVNDCIIHLATSEMGFGGVGTSGMGAYHGKVGFDAFTHYKSIVHKGNFCDLPIRYQPYTKKKIKMLKKFL